MKTKSITYALVVLGGIFPSLSAAESTDTVAVEAALQAYEDALNSNDAAAVAATFTDDGVWMPQHSMPVEGKDAILGAFTYFFDNFNIDAELTVDEVVQMGSDWAFIRSKGVATLTHLESGAEVPASNQEIFLFQRLDEDDWKLARYIFTTTQPMQQ
ncbi:MAG: SgcJ/EcaC family oxidoreductase [Pseudomonadota bacterium]